MTPTPFDISLDDTVGTLYVLAAGAMVHGSHSAPGDDWLILDEDREGNVVGVQLALALDLTLDDWLAHPDRAALPGPLCTAIDDWYRSKPADLRAAMDDPERRAELLASARALAPGEKLPDW